MLALLVALPVGAHADALSDWNFAEKRFQAGDFQTAITYLTRAINAGELNTKQLSKVHQWRGLSFGRLGQKDTALRDYEIAITLDASNFRVHGSICYQKMLKGRLDEALASCNEAIRVKGDHIPAYGIRAMVWERKKAYGEARRDHDHAVKLAPKNWKLRLNRGIFFDKIGDKTAARRDYEAAYKLAPSWGRTRFAATFKKYGIGP